MTQSGAHCHKLIAKVAQGLCSELFDALMQDNEIYDEWKRQHPGASRKGLERAFIGKYWGSSIPHARATLAHMLTLPMSEVEKEEIAEALALDNTLIKGRNDNVRQIASLPTQDGAHS